ncbi:unnamed protein product [Medioppia subpectinata]|uniref:Gustatory receptor n=1 Tax=Medioppia subpectinata TaxID=1979941 RepID=A0A7R9KGF5_9ACAR|nr:unnamed protein product [Medioppia subpectinata]CAG2102810.1 unnamed protein product [Medioppia subpectinata]
MMLTIFYKNISNRNYNRTSLGGTLSIGNTFTVQLVVPYGEVALITPMEYKTVHKVLPTSMITPMAHVKLYHIGLSIKSSYMQWDMKRAIINNPALIHLVIWLQLVRFILTLHLSDNSPDKRGHIMLADLSYLYSIGGHHFTYAEALWSLSLLMIQYVFWYSRNSPGPFTQLFDVLAGHRTPGSIGIMDRKLALKLAMKSRFLFNTVTIGLKYCSLLLPWHIIVGFATKCDLYDTLTWGIWHAMVFVLFSKYTIGFSSWLMVHYYLLCYYLKRKLLLINNRLQRAGNLLRVRNGKPGYPGIDRTLVRALDSIYVEISDYNKTYLSKYILILWLTMGTISVTVMYAIIYQDMAVFLKYTMANAVLLTLLPLVFVRYMSAAVNAEANRSYNLQL